MEHFATPAASDGKLFLATRDTVEAYTIANPAPPTAAPLAPLPPAPKCVLRLRSARVKIHHPKPRGRHRHAPPPFATVSLTARCDEAVRVSVSGRLTERLAKHARRRGANRRAFRVGQVSANLHAGAGRALQVRIGPVALRALERRIPVWASFTLTTVGSTRVHARTRLTL
jgi:hypothetical protein